MPKVPEHICILNTCSTMRVHSLLSVAQSNAFTVLFYESALPTGPPIANWCHSMLLLNINQWMNIEKRTYSLFSEGRVCQSSNALWLTLANHANVLITASCKQNSNTQRFVYINL